MMRKMSICLLICLFFSCSSEEDYVYSEGLSNYVVETYGMDVSSMDNSTLLFIYLEYCRSCVNDALSLIDSTKVINQDLKLFLIGDESTYPENEIMLSNIKNRVPYFKDPDSGHYSFITGINEPLIIKLKNGRLKESTHINKSTFSESWKMLTGSN